MYPPPPVIGVCGGVVQGKVPKELAAATLGTFPTVGIGLLVITPPELGAKDDCVAMDEAELDRVGLGGWGTGVVEGEGAATSGGAETPVGV